MARTIETLAELKSLLAAGAVYVRWDDGIQRSIRRGHSLNHVTGSAEAGLSVNGLPADAGDELLAGCVTEYRGPCGRTAWIVAGREVGRGSDNEPLLDGLRVVARVGDGLLAECDEINAARWARMDAALGWKFTS